ncbi:MAG TPA: CsbD family protein [Terriglobales bacterium]|nr:CsbD family protein [Terriglobales bacterium]
MNKDTLKGKAKDIAGRVERQAGEWTGDKDAQAKGMGRQVEGKVQKAWGDVKDAGNRAKDDIRGKRDADVQPETDIERKRKDEEAA